MVEARTEELVPERVLRTTLHAEPGAPALSHREVTRRWREDTAFVDAFGDHLAGAPFAGFFWETPPVTADDLDRPYEHVLVASRAVAELSADPGPFLGELREDASEEGIATFWNLGTDALLVAPLADVPHPPCAHLAAFQRGAPLERRRALWRAVGAAVEARVGDRPLWVSTSGLGVAWLHVRLDSFPKYYQHGPYRSPR
jgi:hypothetical protein